MHDITLDKLYARHMALVMPLWRGEHHRVVVGINLISLVWTDGEALLPCELLKAYGFVRVFGPWPPMATRNTGPPVTLR